MPLQNRVTPFGDLVAHPSRASLFMGNRGRIHDPVTRTLAGRRWTTRAWIACACSFRGRRREIWSADSYTELFFLDEATALAAGHRPCFECRREAARAFAAAWAAGHGTIPPRAANMDATLHAERIGRTAAPLPEGPLPGGTMVAVGQDALLTTDGRWWRWGFEGYAPTEVPQRVDRVLTPPSVIRALRGGYRPALHPSAA